MDMDAFKPYIEYTAGLLYYLGFDILDTVIAAGTDKLGVSSRPYLLEKARDLGRLISASQFSEPEFDRSASECTQSVYTQFPELPL
jgi:hypothetical protein